LPREKRGVYERAANDYREGTRRIGGVRVGCLSSRLAAQMELTRTGSGPTDWQTVDRSVGRPMDWAFAELELLQVDGEVTRASRG